MAELTPVQTRSLLERYYEGQKAHGRIEASGRPLADYDLDDIDLDGDQYEYLTFSETGAYSLMMSCQMGKEQDYKDRWEWIRTNLQRINVDYLWVNKKKLTIERNKIFPEFERYRDELKKVFENVDDNNNPLLTYKTFYTLKMLINTLGEKAPKPLFDILMSPKKWERRPFPGSAKEAEQKDHLFFWRWIDTLTGPGTPGGILKSSLLDLDRSGHNAAADDLEIAVAHFCADSRRWRADNGASFRTEGHLIAHDAWNKYVRKIGDEYYFFGGDQFIDQGEINPSYLRVAYFRSILAILDPDHPWQKLVPAAYRLLKKNGEMTLGGRNGIGLVSNWLFLDPLSLFRLEPYRDSGIFPFKDGTPTQRRGDLFGFDAIRTLFGVAQDAIWFKADEAMKYLAGPGAKFIADYFDNNGQLPLVMYHDGQAYKNNSKKKIEDYSATYAKPIYYGNYLPFFKAAGNKAIERHAASFLIKFLEEGHFDQYFPSYWAWFGLAAAYDNSYPTPAMKLEMDEQAAKPAPEPLPTPPPEPQAFCHYLDKQFDSDLLDDVFETLLLDPEGVKSLLTAAAQLPATPLELSKRTEPFDPVYERRLAEVFSSPKLNPEAEHCLSGGTVIGPSFWRNQIALLAAFAKNSVENNRLADYPLIIKLCQDFRRLVTEQNRQIRNGTDNIYQTDLHFLGQLDRIEAEIHAQIPNQTLDFYQAGIDLSRSAITSILSVDKNEPDYFSIAMLIVTIGDLNLQMHEFMRKNNFTNSNYYEEAEKYYTLVASMQDSPISDATGLLPDISFPVYKQAFERNRAASLDAKSTAEKSYAYLIGLAMAKKAALIQRKAGIKTIAEVKAALELAQQATNQLERTAFKKPDFFVAFARQAKADLKMALYDHLIYNGEEAISSQYFNPAENIYLAIPRKFPTLVAGSASKLLELASRRGVFVTREFGFLLPFMLDPLLTNYPIPPDEYLGVLNNYVKAVMLVSLAANRKNQDLLETDYVDYSQAARALLTGAQQNLGNLPPIQRKYFNLYLDLKILEIDFIEKNKPGTWKTRFNDLIRRIKAIPKQERKELVWDINSFLAELYTEMGLATKDRINRPTLLEEAKKYCRLSLSEYDREERLAFIEFKLLDVGTEKEGTEQY